MKSKKTGDKGRKTEELVRLYFLKAGFYAVRGVPLRSSERDLTDIDLWLYERSATLARRRIILDIKDKRIPQAAERLFFVKGLAQALGVDGCGVVTTDSQMHLKEYAKKQGVLWIDGADIQRLKASEGLQAEYRLTEEDVLAEIAKVDNARGEVVFKSLYELVKSSVSDRFGPGSANIALDVAHHCGVLATGAHPGSEAARLATRLLYLAASIAAASLDFASADTALRPASERLYAFTNFIRYGHDDDNVVGRLRLAEAIVREYAPNGAGLAQTIREKLMAAFDAVPAEALAEIAVKLTRTDAMFVMARHLEDAAFAPALPSFDQLPTDLKSFLGAVLDFGGVDRAAFAKASGVSSPFIAAPGVHEDGELFGQN